MDLFKPTECFRKYYTIEKYEPKCSCIWKCKYPPPKKLALENNKACKNKKHHYNILGYNMKWKKMLL